MSIKWLEDGAEPFCRSIPRSIDDETLKDLLEFIEYQAVRTLSLDDLGIKDDGDPTDVLFTYVLDALGVPPDGYSNGDDVFGREFFSEVFYQEYLINRKYSDCYDVLQHLKEHALDSRREWLGEH